MINEAEIKCLCGHEEIVHGPFQDQCLYTLFCKCNKYKQDNLFYIERLAKERGLV